MKETFFLSGGKDIVHDGKLFCVKKGEKRNVKFRRSSTFMRVAERVAKIVAKTVA